MTKKINHDKRNIEDKIKKNGYENIDIESEKFDIHKIKIIQNQFHPSQSLKNKEKGPKKLSYIIRKKSA